MKEYYLVIIGKKQVTLNFSELLSCNFAFCLFGKKMYEIVSKINCKEK